MNPGPLVASPALPVWSAAVSWNVWSLGLLLGGSFLPELGLLFILGPVGVTVGCLVLGLVWGATPSDRHWGGGIPPGCVLGDP